MPFNRSCDYDARYLLEAMGSIRGNTVCVKSNLDSGKSCQDHCKYMLKDVIHVEIDQTLDSERFHGTQNHSWMRPVKHIL